MKKSYYENEWANTLATSIALERQANRYVVGRSLLFLLSVISFAFAYDGQPAGGTLGIIFAVLFLFIIKKHRQLSAKVLFTKNKLHVIATYLARFSGDWKKSPEDGFRYREDKRSPHRDIHIFGSPSIYQYICAARTKIGRDRLAASLAPTPSRPIAEIKLRQQAVAELINHPLLAIEMEAMALSLPDGHDTTPLIFKLNKESKHRPTPIRIILRLLSVLPPLALILAFMGQVSWEIPSVLLTLNLILAMALYRRHQEILTPLAKTAGELRLYSDLFIMLDKAPLTGKAIRTLLSPLNTPLSARKEINKLAKLAELVAMRNNFIFFIMANALCLWDFYCVSYFTHWRLHAGRQAGSWLATWGEMEVLLSLAVVGYTRQVHSFPVFLNSDVPELTMQDGTPLLIPESVAVPNDADLTAGVVMITGSNMAGKTTYMRTLGSNAVLAYAGAPVCTRSLRLTPMAVFTSLQINDDLSQGVSTFYAELLRIKKMMEYSRRGEKMLILIDEIFKGTNYADRLVGASEAIRHLNLPHAITIVSTHDAELCKLDVSPLTNFHFEEYYEGDEIKFDFKLKEGVCTTANAQHLLRMAGIITDEVKTAP